MNSTNEKAAGVLDTLATAQEITQPDSTPTLADFATWLTNNQSRALASMKARPEEGFAQHCTEFSELFTAIKVLHQFELEMELIEAAKKDGAA